MTRIGPIKYHAHSICS